jgi:hypothetical protein
VVELLLVEYTTTGGRTSVGHAFYLMYWVGGRLFNRGGRGERGF